MSTHIEIEGYKVQFYKNSKIDNNSKQATSSLIPETKLILTPTTRSNLRKIITPLLAGHNLLLVGDAGVGKNALIYYINYLRKMPTLRYSFNEDTMPEDLVGSYRIDSLNHLFVWSDGPLAQALKMGVSFVADEMNLCGPEILKRFYNLFTDQKLQLLEGDASDVLGEHGFNFIATQNPIENFEGRKELPREIRKYFTTIYIDPYTDKELIEILSQIETSLPIELVELLVEINSKIELLIQKNLIGNQDLERYHFNLRNLKKLAQRLAIHNDSWDKKKNRNETFFLEEELADIYIRSFRKKEDLQLLISEISSLIEEKFIGYKCDFNFLNLHSHEKEETHSKDIQLQVDRNKKIVQIGRSSLAPLKDNFSNQEFESAIVQALENFPLLPHNLQYIESIARAIENRENILLECTPNVEVEGYVEFFSTLLGRPLRTITLSKGMHTSDILGALKPSTSKSTNLSDAVKWFDGPLTSALRSGEFILLRGLEAAGPELIEKLNMLLDDAKALTLPPEVGEQTNIPLPKETRIFALKFFRKQRSTSTISRAFRNRFTSIVIEEIRDRPSLVGFCKHLLKNEDALTNALVHTLVDFHLAIIELSHKRQIGTEKIQSYEYGLTNLKKCCVHIKNIQIKQDALSLKNNMIEAVNLAYLNEIASIEERQKCLKLLIEFFDGLDLENYLSRLPPDNEGGGLIKKSSPVKKVYWDQEKHLRPPNTGKFEPKVYGRSKKKGLNINTPETGGKTKEGPDAWYGSDTQGNKGQGEPGGGGGSWGYRTENLYLDFIARRKNLWSYDMGLSYKEFLNVFGPELEKVVLDFDRLLESNSKLERLYKSQGSRVDLRKYLSYQIGAGDERIFDKSSIISEANRLKGVELILAMNKGRRMFNYEYSLSCIVAIMGIALLFKEHKIPFSVNAYSDLENLKQSVNLECYKKRDELMDENMDTHMFHQLTECWNGDTVQESPILDELADSFHPTDSRTKILVLFSDFRGFRAKAYREHEINSKELLTFKDTIERIRKRGIHLLGVGLGPRNLAEHFFEETISLDGENFSHLPAMLTTKICNLIHRHHQYA